MDSTARQAAPSTRYYSRSMQRARVRPWVIASSHQARVAPALATTVVRLLSIRFRFRARDPDDVEDERSTNHSCMQWMLSRLLMVYQPNAAGGYNTLLN
jgi:hypothetical protein